MTVAHSRDIEKQIKIWRSHSFSSTKFIEEKKISYFNGVKHIMKKNSKRILVNKPNNCHFRRQPDFPLSWSSTWSWFYRSKWINIHTPLDFRFGCSFLQFIRKLQTCSSNLDYNFGRKVHVQLHFLIQLKDSHLQYASLVYRTT